MLDYVFRSCCMCVRHCKRLIKALKSAPHFSRDNKVHVTQKKIRVMFFTKGGITSKYEKWFYVNSTLEVVKHFDYVRIHFAFRLFFIKFLNIWKTSSSAHFKVLEKS